MYLDGLAACNSRHTWFFHVQHFRCSGLCTNGDAHLPWNEAPMKCFTFSTHILSPSSSDSLDCTLYCCVPPGLNPTPSCGFPIIPKIIPKTRARCRRGFPEADTFHRCVNPAIKSFEGINLCISRAPMKSKRFRLGLSANRWLAGLENQLRSEDK